MYGRWDDWAVIGFGGVGDDGARKEWTIDNIGSGSRMVWLSVELGTWNLIVAGDLLEEKISPFLGTQKTALPGLIDWSQLSLVSYFYSERERCSSVLTFEMDCHENPQDQNPPHTVQNYPLISKLKPFTFWVSAVLILLLAIFLSFTKTGFFKLHYLKSSLSLRHLNPTLINRVLGLFLSTHRGKETPAAETNPLSPYCVLWMAPFLSGGGYSSEAWAYMMALHENIRTPIFKLAIEQHGDLESLEFWEGLPKGIKDLAFELYSTECRMNETIVICHSEPGAWYPPLFETLPCPPTGYEEPLFVIGRTMFETDRVNPGHVKRCNRMDSVWVPTEFHVSTFIQSGVESSKVLKIVQPVDVKFFDPSKYKPLPLASRAKLILGSVTGISNSQNRKFVFLSIFKWEYRKGWDLLLRSYLKEFSGKDNVALYLLTNPYHSDRNFGNKIIDFVEGSELENPINGWPLVYLIDNHIAQMDLPRIYRAADVFVLPSRGEGWGRPFVEAMAMSLPVIATNWSGPTEYLSEENSYPLPVDEMSEVMEGPFKGHFWAEPSVDKLRVLMRHVMSNPEEGIEKGKKAREDMMRRFSPEWSCTTCFGKEAAVEAFVKKIVILTRGFLTSLSANEEKTMNVKVRLRV
ncbi:hypothetical protein NE237_010638 [Protea cynaroides]|uniref:Glycosyl transferase family 1 domain-containing protein n=1 Tax=Protea cynaroides TaxID=273540 RepID=A0A9Q0R1G3_9MAGN|nr:hypothetical protein NE237_010638 [Protea cynaroides]